MKPLFSGPRGQLSGHPLLSGRLIGVSLYIGYFGHNFWPEKANCLTGECYLVVMFSKILLDKNTSLRIQKVFGCSG